MESALLQFAGVAIGAGLVGGLAYVAGWRRGYDAEGKLNALLAEARSAAAEPDVRPATLGGVELPSFSRPPQPAGRTGRCDTPYVTGSFRDDRGCVYFCGFLEEPPVRSADWVKLQRRGRWRVLPANHPYRIAFDEGMKRPEGDPLRRAWELTRGTPPTAASRLWEWQDAPADDRAA